MTSDSICLMCGGNDCKTNFCDSTPDWELEQWDDNDWNAFGPMLKIDASFGTTTVDIWIVEYVEGSPIGGWKPRIETNMAEFGSEQELAVISEGHYGSLREAITMCESLAVCVASKIKDMDLSKVIADEIIKRVGRTA